MKSLQNIIILGLVIICIYATSSILYQTYTVQRLTDNKIQSNNSKTRLNPNVSKADGLADYFDHIYQCDTLADNISDAMNDLYGFGNDSGISASQGPALIDEWARLGCGITMSVPD